MFSPWPSRIPTCRLRESGPKHVPKVSPTPERPKTVDGSPPIITTTRRISEHPRVTSAAIAFVPRPSPSQRPAAIAMTFLIAPPTSTPITSGVYSARKLVDESSVHTSIARLRSYEAIVTAVTMPLTISAANDGPER